MVYASGLSGAFHFGIKHQNIKLLNDGERCWLKTFVSFLTFVEKYNKQVSTLLPYFLAGLIRDNLRGSKFSNLPFISLQNKLIRFVWWVYCAVY